VHGHVLDGTSLLGVHLECAEELLARGRLLVRRTQLIGGVGVLVAQPFKL